MSLHAFGEEYCELVRNWRNSREVYYNLFTWVHITPEMQKQWYDSKTRSGEINNYFIIKENKNSTPIGLIYAGAVELAHQRATFGFFIPDEKSRLPGFAMEAEFLFLNYQFDHCNLNKITCDVFLFNEAVVNMHKKFGFEVEGHLKEHIMHDGTLKDVILLGLRKSRYSEFRPKIAKLIDRLG